ncbi:MAG: OadG family transporter subunit [Bacteroidales bacterium]|nr:OadG family transporter subunit [Bacteroidales bacterium]
MRKRISLLCFLLLLLAIGAQAQQATKMRINEVLVNNLDNYVDDYGQKVPWIELFNSSYNTVNVEGCYLTNDINNPKMYMIPKGDVLTEVQTRQQVLFFADNKPTRGTFHLNFTLSADRENNIYFFDADGKTLIDSVTVPVQAADVSWGRVLDGEEKWAAISKTTPKANNKTLDANIKVESFAKNDPNGGGMSLSAMGVVFLVLIFLALFFKVFSVISIRMTASREAKVTGGDIKVISKKEISGEVHAAIAMALYELNNDVHDIENTVLTITRTRRPYSPWSSKIYGLNQIPNKK